MLLHVVHKTHRAVQASGRQCVPVLIIRILHKSLCFTSRSECGLFNQSKRSEEGEEELKAGLNEGERR